VRISTRLWLLFLLVAVLPLGLFSYFNLQEDEGTLRAGTLETMSVQADKKVIQVKDYLAEREREVRMLARTPQVIDGISGIQDAYIAGLQNAGYIRADAKLHQFFERYIEESGLFLDVYLISKNGEVVYTQKHAADLATNLLEGPWSGSQLAQAFLNVRMTLEPLISGYDYYEPSKSPALFIAAPVMDNGKFVGVFAAQLGNELFYRVATDATGLGQSGEVELARLDGDSVLYTTPLKYHADSAMKFRQSRQQNKTVPMFDALSGESGEGVRTDYRDKAVVAAWRYLPELDWGMVVKIDAEEALASLIKKRNLLLETFFGLLLFAGLIAYSFGRQISVPLNGLVQTANEVADGHLSKRANESVPGELGQFARAFNNMTAKLEGFHKTLEERITERTRELSSANEELRRHQHLLNEAQRLGQLGIWELNLNSGEFKLSDEMFQIFGLDRKSCITYQNLVDAIHPDDHDMVNLAQTKSLESKQPYDIQYRLLLAGAHVKWVRALCGSDLDVYGKPVRSVGMVQDITAQKLAEETLRIASIAFESQESLVITDADGVILRVNQAFTKSTGYAADEVVGQTPRLLKSGRHDEGFYRRMWKSIMQTGSWHGEIWDRRKDGVVYPKLLTITAVKGNDGAVTHYVGSHIDITERKVAEEKIQNLAFYDYLTNLPNRRLLMDRLQHALVSSVRSGRHGALLFMDLDNFKAINDTLGHAIGDLLLQQVAQRLISCVRESDTVARLGGDEFVVMLEGLGEDPLEAAAGTEAFGEKILAILNQPYVLATHELHSTPSVGATLFHGHARGAEELLKQADIAMYQAKRAGRNSLRFFDPKMQDAINANAILEEELRKALESGQLQLHYQIQVDGSCHAVGVEALIRWMHPERGPVSPVQFIPLAEKAGLIMPIGDWVLETACAQLNAWQHDVLARDLILAVNVSARQFHQSNFAAKVRAVLQRHAVRPARLKLELTESLLLEDVDDAIATMNALKEIGVQFSLDDFGTGYSSLQYLKRLPLDQLKIDQSFVRDIATDSSDKSIVSTIIAMARSLNLGVIAEGVETEEQRQFLLDSGCTHYQGYLFGRPLPIEQFEALLKRS
jgi:diguanylate cyclase (GGDEF)-like protein/PAS domain S-box-containing protein